MKILITLLLAASTAFAAESPYLVEARVRTDLEGLLSRLIPSDQYLLQVNAEVRVDEQRKVVEGEESQDVEAAAKITPPDPLPGFVPETPDPVPAADKHLRHTYRSVETPVLTAIRVNIGFDQELPQKVTAQTKNLIQTYLFANYPDVVRLSFLDVAMLKAPKKDKDAPVLPQNPADAVEEEESLADLATKYFPWIALAAIGLYLVLRRRAPVEAPKPARSQSRPRWSQPPQVAAPMMAAPYAPAPQQAAATAALAPSAPVSGSARTRFLERAVSNANAFRAYYEMLTPELRGEIETVLGGPAFESLMENFHFDRPQPSGPSGDLEDMAAAYEAQFNEFVNAKLSQDKQFFGFLNQLTREQLASLMTFESDLTVCLMMRFMKPVQCAAVLDGLPAQRRHAVLSRLDEAQQIPLSEIATIERDIREAVRRLPAYAIGPGPSQVDFWSSVLSESTRQAEILRDLEATNPGISPSLQKFKFSLEDAATLPDDFLKKVTSEMDNEELALAISTCSADVAEVVMGSLPERRANLLQGQLNSARSAPRDKAQRARNTFTKRIREAMAQ